MANGQASQSVSGDWETVTPKQADSEWETVTPPSSAKTKTAPPGTYPSQDKFAEGMMPSFLKPAGRAMDAAMSTILQKGYSLGGHLPGKLGETYKGYSSEYQPATTTSGKVGETVGEVLPWVAPIPGLSGAKTVLGKVAQGAADVGIRSAVSEGDPKAGIAGAAVGGVLEGAAPLIAKGLKAGARSQYGKILHPAGQAAKEITEAKLLTGKSGDLVGQGYGNTAWTKKGLKATFEANRTAANKALEAEYQNVPHSAKVNLRPVITDLQNFVVKNAMLPNGNIADQALFNQAVRWSNKIVKDMGPAWPDAHPSDVRRFKQILDDQLFKKRLKFNPTTASDQVKTMLVNSVREHLHKQHPNLAAVDSSAHFWKTAATMLGRSNTAEMGKYNLHRVVRLGVHGAIGGEAGREKGGYEGAAIGAVAGAALGRAFESTAWRSVSAVTKDKIADLIARGNSQMAASVATRAVGMAAGKAVSGGVSINEPSFAPAAVEAASNSSPNSSPMGSEFIPASPAAPTPEPLEADASSSYSGEEEPQ